MDARSVEPHLFVIFGAGGDLTRRKLMPALCRLGRQGVLGNRYAVLGVARADRTDASFRAVAREALAAGGCVPEDIRQCEGRLYYQPIAPHGFDDYRGVRERIEAIERVHDLPGNRVFYLAVPPDAFPAAVTGLGETGLNRGPGWTRMVVEKPFGRDLESARKLNRLVHGKFREEQIYRIDHYLGKETVQNLLVFRFANAFFETQWNREHIASVQITVAEDLGVEHRAGYYDHAGAVRDIVQNHLTQLLALVAMEPPVALDADAIRYEKVKVLRSVVPLEPENVVLGQYERGTIAGREVAGYREEQGVPDDSRTETYAALRLEVSNWRWQGVPFYLRTGKRLAGRLTQIVITFRHPPVWLFREAGSEMHTNRLRLRLQPNEGFALCFDVKQPGPGMGLETMPLHFDYREAFGELPLAYETLIRDVLIGDQTLFVHADETEAAWRLYTPLLTEKLPLRPYRAGSWGPAEGDALLARDGEQWEDVPAEVKAEWRTCEP